MKRALIIILVFSQSFLLVGQDSSCQNAREEVKQYFENTVYPLIKKQQENYLSKLNESEKIELTKIKSDISKRENHFKGRRNRVCKYNETNKPGSSPNYREQIKKITDAHPKSNSSYTSFIESNRQKWVTDIEEIHSKNNVEARMNKNKERGADVFLDRVSNPDWLMLWDSSNKGIMHQSNNKCPNKRGDHTKNKQRENSNSEFRSAINDYTEKNVIPVIASEREKFDSKLNDSERETIVAAQKKIQVRKLMYKNWSESDDFVPGQHAKDPNFDDMRDDMRSSMKEVSEIAASHEEEINKSMSAIEENSGSWRKDMAEIANKYGVNYERIRESGMRGQLEIPTTPIKFILFDPTKKEE